MGTANMPVPIIPKVKRRYALFPTSGFNAIAACSAVEIFVIPEENSVAAHVAIIKYMTRFEINIPVQTSIRIFLISRLLILDRSPLANLLLNVSSSTSCDVCQKKRYGEIVVPKTAQTIII